MLGTAAVRTPRVDSCQCASKFQKTAPSSGVWVQITEYEPYEICMCKHPITFGYPKFDSSPQKRESSSLGPHGAAKPQWILQVSKLFELGLTFSPSWHSHGEHVLSVAPGSSRGCFGEGKLMLIDITSNLHGPLDLVCSSHVETREERMLPTIIMINAYKNPDEDNSCRVSWPIVPQISGGDSVPYICCFRGTNTIFVRQAQLRLPASHL